MQNLINVSLQLIPKSKHKDSYTIVDKAIEIIQNSGIKHQVCPFETVMEGRYDKLMEIIKQIHEVCFEYGSDEIISIIKIQANRHSDVTIEDKMCKYVN